MTVERRIAYLAPELPSASSAFLHEEINHLIEEGYDVAAYSVKRPSRKSLPGDAAAVAKACTSLHANPIGLVLVAAKFAIMHPLRAGRCIKMMVSDFRTGRFDGQEKRAVLPFRALAALTLADRLMLRGIEHLHVHFADVPATIGMYAAAAADIPLSITAHDTDLYCRASLLEKKLERADAFTTVSLANRGYLLEQLGTRASKVQVIHSGINIATFPPRSSESGAGSNVIFAAGPLVPRKGFDVLLYALALLGDTRPDIRVAIAGCGPHKQRLEELADRLHVRDRVSLLGHVSRDDIRTHLAAAGLFALPCRSALSGDRDAIPVALIEAMACAVPVVSTRFSGIPELVEHERSGLLVDPDDPVDLAASIIRVLDDETLRRGFPSAARQRVKERFDLANNTLELVEVFKAAIRKHHAESQEADAGNSAQDLDPGKSAPAAGATA